MGFRIAIDCRTLQDASRLRGVGNVVRHLIPELMQSGLQFVLYGDKNGVDFESFGLPLIKKPRFESMIGFLKRHDVAFFLFTAQFGVPHRFRFPHAVLVHDIFSGYRGVALGQDHAHQERLAKRLAYAAFFFAVSEYTKLQMIHCLGVSPSKIQVTYPGATTHLCQLAAQPLRPFWGFQGKFILTIGNVEPRKNQMNMILAALSLNRGREDKIHYVGVLGGRCRPTRAMIRAIEREGQAEYFHFFSYVSDEDLLAFYQHCALFCFVSKAEGFGLPLLEAMRFDIPILTGTESALPEVGQDGVVYADPEDVADIAQQMMLCLDQPSLSADLKLKRQAILNQFTYEKMGSELAARLFSLSEADSK